MTTAFPYPPRHVVPTSRVPASRIPAPSNKMKKQDPQQRLVGNTRSRLEVLQQQYQQKLLREREAKMIDIYQKNQQAALQKVNQQTSLRNFFKERRSLEATKGGAVPSIQHHYKNKVKQQNQFGYKSKQPVWNPARTRRGPEAERKPWSGINRGNPLQPIQRQAISADDRYRQPDLDGHYETSDDLTSNHSSNPPSDLEDEDVEFKFVPKPPVQQRPGKVRQTRRTVKQDRNDVKQFSPEDDGYYSNQQDDGGYSGNPARESDDQPPTNFAKAKLLGKIKQKERDRIASREGTFHSDNGEKESAEDKDQPNEGERKNKRDVLKQQEAELMALLRQRQEELEKLKRENEEAERLEEERKRKEAQRRKQLQEERQRREEELRRLEEEEQKELEEEGNDEQNSSRHEEDEDDWYQNKEKEDGEDNQYQNKEQEDDEDNWFQNKEKEEQNFNATYTMKQKEKPVKHEMPKKEHQSQRQKEAKPNEDLAFYIEAAEGSEDVSLNLTPCPNCGRKFAVERLAKHQKVCSSMKKRKVMDPTKMRTQGTEMEKYADPRDKRPDPKSKKADWRKKREDFIQAIRYAKKVAEVEKNGGSAADLPPPPRSENPDYKQCPYCQRKFNQTAAERHIPRCKEIKSRPPPMKRR